MTELGGALTGAVGRTAGGCRGPAGAGSRDNAAAAAAAEPGGARVNDSDNARLVGLVGDGKLYTRAGTGPGAWSVASSGGCGRGRRVPGTKGVFVVCRDVADVIVLNRACCSSGGNCSKDGKTSTLSLSGGNARGVKKHKQRQTETDIGMVRRAASGKQQQDLHGGTLKRFFCEHSWCCWWGTGVHRCFLCRCWRHNRCSSWRHNGCNSWRRNGCSSWRHNGCSSWRHNGCSSWRHNGCSNSSSWRSSYC